VSIRKEIQHILDTAITVDNDCHIIPKLDQILTYLKIEIEKIENPYDKACFRGEAYEGFRQDILAKLSEE